MKISRISTDFSAEKCFKLNVNVCTTWKVSPVQKKAQLCSVLAKESFSWFHDSCRARGKVNKEINNEVEELLSPNRALCSVGKPYNPYRSNQSNSINPLATNTSRLLEMGGSKCKRVAHRKILRTLKPKMLKPESLLRRICNERKKATLCQSFRQKPLIVHHSLCACFEDYSTASHKLLKYKNKLLNRNQSPLGQSCSNPNKEGSEARASLQLLQCKFSHKESSERSKVSPCDELRSMQPKKVSARCRKARLAQNPIPFQQLQLFQRTKLINANIRRSLLVSTGTIEKNPGPAPRARNERTSGSTIMVTSYNVRGLGDELKLRHLVNSCYKKVANSTDRDFIFCFQETYIGSPNKIPYLWRGNFHLTGGNGHSCGCLTLLSSHINIIHAQDFGDRGHLLVCQRTGDPKASYIIANLYAPCPNSQAKIDFFENVFDAISEAIITYECQNVLVMGDFNLNFKESEVKNRLYTAQERRIAQIVLNFSSGLGLKDVWHDSSKFTWRRPNTDTFSTIDRILYSESSLKPSATKAEWAMSLSDHAAVEAGFKLKDIETKSKSKITRLDPSLLKNEVGKRKFIEEFEQMYSGIGEGWNPHLKLEFAKMCIRTVAEKLQADRKKKDKSEEEEVNEELNLAINALAGEISEEERIEVIEYIEELRNKKSALVEERGERLAEKLGTKWYNEGEKSTRYFLNLLNRKAPDSFKVITNKDGDEVNSQEGIEKEIVDFYKSLYEEYDKSKIKEIDVNNDFFQHLTSIANDEDDQVSAPITVEELGKTLVKTKDTAPGPDGIPYSFYGALWNIMGPLMVEAWNFTLQTGNLCPSHKVSFLKLIPKIGKDLKKLTNWRPITLSNCDHKLITKTYSDRIGAVVAQHIKERQTAYLKGRLINDNIRAIIASINLTNQNVDLDALIVSLDAKKAFDSVEHSYIKHCLIKFGLKKFVPIFEILYSELSCDIIVNGRIVQGFRTLRGVKQGDALSCVLFIICMEPLLRNVEENPRIENMNCPQLGAIPKAYAYADDVNAVIKNNPMALQELFKEYGRLTEASGLELNADKTEIMQLRASNQFVHEVPVINFNVTYAGQQYDLKTCKEIKINGILFQQHEEEATQANVNMVLRKINSILQKWSARHLSTLGKILIVKTFAISQVIYLMQSMVLTNEHFKEINKILFKFIWNRHFQASKAPERIKRDIVYTPVKYGGLGMLDLSSIDRSLKLKAFARLCTTNHPFLSKVYSRVDLTDYCYPKSNYELERVSKEAIRLLKEIRLSHVGLERLTSNRTYIELIKTMKLVNIVNRLGRSSVPYFNLKRQNKSSVGDLDPTALNSIRTFIKPSLYAELSRVVNLRTPRIPNLDYRTLFLKGKSYVTMTKLTSKEIRTELKQYDPICLFKLGASCTKAVSLNWGLHLTKVGCVRHRNNLLRVAHGDVYTKEKLFRFGLIDSPNCPRCGEIENLEHKFITCAYIKRIWDVTFQLTKTISNFDLNTDRTNLILGLMRESTPLVLSIHAEVIARITALRDQADYLLRPRILVRLALELILRREKSDELKTSLKDLLDRLQA